MSSSSLQNNRWKRQNFVRYSDAVDIDEYYTVDYVEPVDALQGQVCDRSIQLNGPRSPLESEMYSALVQNSKSAITIDAHSVNSVLLTPLQQVSSILEMN